MNKMVIQDRHCINYF